MSSSQVSEQDPNDDIPFLPLSQNNEEASILFPSDMEPPTLQHDLNSSTSSSIPIKPVSLLHIENRYLEHPFITYDASNLQAQDETSEQSDSSTFPIVDGSLNESDSMSESELPYSVDQFLVNDESSTSPSMGAKSKKRKTRVAESTDIPLPPPKRPRNDIIASRVFHLHKKLTFRNVAIRLFPGVSARKAKKILGKNIQTRAFLVDVDCDGNQVHVTQEIFPCAISNPTTADKQTHDCMVKKLDFSIGVGNAAPHSVKGTAVCKGPCNDHHQTGSDLRVLVFVDSKDTPIAYSAVCRILVNRTKKSRGKVNAAQRVGLDPSVVPKYADPSNPMFPQPTELLGRL